MIRTATAADLDAIDALYQAHFEHERIHGAYTVFEAGVYPTRAHAEAALQAQGLYVYADANGQVLASLILHAAQPEEYRHIAWPSAAAAAEVWVLHLLMVHPSLAGQGIGASLVRFGLDLAAANHKRAVRLDTGAQNLPAVALYRKLGFELAAQTDMQVGGAIAHSDHLFFEKIL